jgi:hypothetical protein
MLIDEVRSNMLAVKHDTLLCTQKSSWKKTYKMLMHVEDFFLLVQSS